ncbi:Probable Co/Zn/Cd efflux system membrane fusion protein [hydrothermal vent metagenome]|uniref:Probable Co/Zn/Cd efflux system membrane fusion protein n=1 Tax=hydrothermal vent metagenome TaxID=652676 RepID=A0A3B0XMF5_9ZZZZ
MNIKNIFMLLILSSSLSYLPVAMATAGNDEHKEHAEEHHDDEHHDETASATDHKDDHGDEKEQHDDHDKNEEHHDDEHHNENTGGADHKDDHGDEKEQHDDHGNAHGDEHEEGADAHGGHGGHEEEGATKLTSAQMKIADIVVQPLMPQAISSAIKAPGEVRFNTYKTSLITPRIAAQVIDRHVVLGQVVKKGQPIVTLSSVEMAQAQGDLLVADKEWKRVKKLGRKVVSARRYTEAKINWELAKAKVKAYGMSGPQIEKLLTSKDFSRANGRFELVASIAGTVLKENYILGQQADPGEELIRITDESTLWVIANVSPAVAHEIRVGNNASVQFGKRIFPAKVAQINHSLDEITRTTGIRLLVENNDDALHPGLFVTAQIETSGQTTALAVPEAAVLRSPDGDWQIFVEQDEAGEFKGVEVELLRVSDGMAIISGVKPTTRVVVEGAFFVQSELAKSGFEIHNH